MIRTTGLTGLWIASVLAAGGTGTTPPRSVPQCAGVSLSASYLAATGPDQGSNESSDQGPGFRFTVSNKTSHEIRLMQPVPSSAHWYARSNGRWLWRASNGAGGSLVNAGNEQGRLAVYSVATPKGDGGLLVVPPRQSRQWTAHQKDNPVLAYNPGCPQCSYPGERQYQVIFAYAWAAGNGQPAGLLPCGLRSLPVPMPPKF